MGRSVAGLAMHLMPLLLPLLLLLLFIRVSIFIFFSSTCAFSRLASLCVFVRRFVAVADDSDDDFLFRRNFVNRFCMLRLAESAFLVYSARADKTFTSTHACVRARGVMTSLCLYAHLCA